LLRLLRSFQEGETLFAHSELDLQGEEREGFVPSSKGLVSVAQLTGSILSHVVALVMSPCKATRFTVVTSRGRLSKEVKEWLQRSNARHQTIGAKVVKRLGQTKKLERATCGMRGSGQICLTWTDKALLAFFSRGSNTHHNQASNIMKDSM